MFNTFEDEFDDYREDEWDDNQEDDCGYDYDHWDEGYSTFDYSYYADRDNIALGGVYDCEYGQEYLDSRGSEFDGDAEATLLMSYDYDDTHVENFDDDEYSPVMTYYYDDIYDDPLEEDAESTLLMSCEHDDTHVGKSDEDAESSLLMSCEHEDITIEMLDEDSIPF